MKTSLTLLVLGIVGALGIGGVVRSVYAEQAQPPAAEAAKSRQASVLTQESKEYDEASDDDDEVTQFQSLAKITAQQALDIAEAAQGKTAIAVELEVEDGSLVYEVEFSDVEVVVDAGDGQILETEVEDQEDDDAAETPIQGSIQVPNYSDDDDDD